MTESRPSRVSSKQCDVSWCAVSIITRCPRDFRARAASTTARSAPPIPKSGCKNTTFNISITKITLYIKTFKEHRHSFSVGNLTRPHFYTKKGSKQKGFEFELELVLSHRHTLSLAHDGSARVLWERRRKPMEKPKIWPLATLKPLNRSTPKFARVITSRISPSLQNFVQIGPGVFSSHMGEI